MVGARQHPDSFCNLNVFRVLQSIQTFLITNVAGDFLKLQAGAGWPMGKAGFTIVGRGPSGLSGGPTGCSGPLTTTQKKKERKEIRNKCSAAANKSVGH